MKIKRVWFFFRLWKGLWLRRMDYLFKVLDIMNFGPSFLTWFHTPYKNISSCVINNGYFSELFFFIKRSPSFRTTLRSCSRTTRPSDQNLNSVTINRKPKSKTKYLWLGALKCRLQAKTSLLVFRGQSRMPLRLAESRFLTMCAFVDFLKSPSSCLFSTWNSWGRLVASLARWE